MFTIRLAKQIVQGCAHQGACDDDVAYWEKHLPQLRRIKSDAIRAVLKEYGAWSDEELADDYQNRLRILWCAANDCKDNGTCTSYF